MIDEKTNPTGGKTGEVSIDKLLKVAVEANKGEKEKFDAGLSGIKTCMKIIAATTNDYYQKTDFYTESRIHAKVNVNSLKQPSFGYYPKGIVDGDLSLTSRDGKVIFVFQEGSRGNAKKACWGIPVEKLDCILACNFLKFKEMIIEYLQILGNQ